MDDLLTWLSIAAALLSGVVAWGFATGKWIQKIEAATGPEIAALRNELHDVKELIEKDDLARRQTTDRMNAAIGRVVRRLVVIEAHREGELESLEALQRETRKHRDWLIELGVELGGRLERS